MGIIKAKAQHRPMFILKKIVVTKKIALRLSDSAHVEYVSHLIIIKYVSLIKSYSGKHELTIDIYINEWLCHMKNISDVVAMRLILIVRQLNNIQCVLLILESL